MRSTTGGMGSLLVIRVSAGQPRISGRIVFQSHGNQGTLWKEAKVEIIGGGESVQVGGFYCNRNQALIGRRCCAFAEGIFEGFRIMNCNSTTY